MKALKERLAALDAVVTAIAHPARRQILLTIDFRGGEMTAGDIARRFEHSWPTTTKHLQVLERAGLVTERRDGRTRIYSIVRGRLDLVSKWLDSFSASTIRDQT